MPILATSPDWTQQAYHAHNRASNTCPRCSPLAQCWCHLMAPACQTGPLPSACSPDTSLSWRCAASTRSLAAAGPLHCQRSNLFVSLPRTPEWLSFVNRLNRALVSSCASSLCLGKSPRMRWLMAGERDTGQTAEGPSPWSLRAVSTMTPLSSPTRHSAIRLGWVPGRPCLVATSFASMTCGRNVHTPVMVI